MDLQSVTAVFLRILSLSFLLSIFQTVLHLFYAKADIGLVFTTALTVGVLFVFFVFLWMLSLPLSRLVTRKIPKDVSLGALSIVDCYSVGFVMAGLFYAVGNMPDVVYVTFDIFRMIVSTPWDGWKHQIDWYPMARAMIPFAAGVALVLKGPSLARHLAKAGERGESAGSSSS